MKYKVKIEYSYGCHELGFLFDNSFDAVTFGQMCVNHMVEYDGCPFDEEDDVGEFSVYVEIIKED